MSPTFTMGSLSPCSHMVQAEREAQASSDPCCIQQGLCKSPEAPGRLQLPSVHHEGLLLLHFMQGICLKH